MEPLADRIEFQIELSWYIVSRVLQKKVPNGTRKDQRATPNGAAAPDRQRDGTLKKHQKCLAPLAFAFGMTVAGAATAQTLTMGARDGPESMDPHFAALGSHAETAKHIFDTLFWSGTDLQIEPDLATS
jgi:peptide/nickel transport system substrate-binding protein